MMSYKTACPSCREEGRDRSGDNLTVFPEGNTYCHACGYKGWSEGMKPEVDVFVKPSSLTVAEIELFPSGTDSKRKLTFGVVDHFGIKVSYDVFKGSMESVYYPYYEDGVVVAYKQRKLGVDKKRAFQMIGKATRLFGDNPNSKHSGNLLLVEGEEDALAAWEMLNIGVPPKACDVMSLPNGAGLDKTTMAQHDMFKMYKNIYLCLDADGVGRSAVDKIYPWLSRITKTRVVELDPTIGKDASDYHVGGHQKEFLLAIRDAKERPLTGIVPFSSLSLKELLVPEPVGYKIPFRGLQKALRGLKKGMLHTVTAESGIGKTTFTKELALSLVEQDAKIVLMSMEEQMDTSAKALIAMDMKIPLEDFEESPPLESECQTSFDKFADKVMCFKDEDKSVDTEKLLSLITSYAKTGIPDFIIVDHLGIALSSTTPTAMNEAKMIDVFMQKLTDIIKSTGVGIILVAHVKRSAGEVPPEGGRVLKLTDLRGSAAIEQYSFNVIGLERDQQAEDDKEKNKLRVRILKNRKNGVTGITDYLTYDIHTGRLVGTVTPPPVEPIELEV